MSRRRRRSFTVERLEARQLLAGDMASVVPDALPRFESIDQVKEFLIAESLRLYADQFGQSSYWPIFLGLEIGDRNVFTTAVTNGLADTTGPIAAQSYSSTNVQVAGVDEADLVETNGRSLFLIRGTELTIVAADPADALAIESRVTLPGMANGEFLIGDRLTVITTQGHWWGVNPMFDRMTVTGMPFEPYMSFRSTVTISVYDVADPTAPSLVERTQLDGNYQDARAIGDKVFVIIGNNDLQLPPPELICPPTDPVVDDPTTTGDESGEPVDDNLIEPMSNLSLWSPWGRFWPGGSSNCTYETQDVYLARLEPQLDAMIDGLLPHFTTWDGDGSFVRGGILHEPGDVVRPVVDDPQQLLSVVSFDPFDSQAGPLGAEGIPVGWNSNIYGSTEHLYVFQSDWGNGAGTAHTNILRFDWSSSTGSIRASAAGEVPGMTLNQFSADEYEDRLRIATTESHWEPDTGLVTNNGVYILESEGTSLDIVGSVTGLGPGETIRSVRFFGDEAFVVTFRQIDPLYALDLSDPTNPKVAGELKIPGFSGYLQHVDATHLVGIGRVQDEQNLWRVQVSLFDVSDLTNPTRTGQFEFPASVWWTAAESDHHAFGWYPEWQLLGIPIQGSVLVPHDPTTGELFGSVYHPYSALALLHIETQPVAGAASAVQLVTQIEQPSPTQRSLRIGGALYAIATEQVTSISGADPTTTLDALDLGPVPWDHPEGYWGISPLVSDDTPVLRAWVDEAPPSDPTGTPTPWDNHELSEVLHIAADQLADHSQLSDNEIRLVTAEAASWQQDGQSLDGYNLVFGVGDDYYLMRATSDPAAEQPIELLDENFEFSHDLLAGDWHNIEQPCDTDGDGLTSPIDGLIVINDLNLRGARSLLSERPLRSIEVGSNLSGNIQAGYRRWLDSNGDNYLSPIDALLVINWLNEHLALPTAPVDGGTGEGESWEGLSAPALPLAGSALSPRWVDAAVQDFDTLSSIDLTLSTSSDCTSAADDDDAIAVVMGEF